ncbi:MAG TPA: hypothetical protein VIZ68_05075, partial [Thermoplasmata archaeon]
MLYFALQAPLPPGTDPGEWIAGSYQFVGLPGPTWYDNSDSPPVLGFVLGYLVLVGHGPIVAADLFLVLESVLLCVSTYMVARSFAHYQVTALAASFFILANPTVDGLLFSGAYQFLLAWVFLNLTVAYVIRFVRSRSTWHLALFWLSATAAVLTHPSMVVEVLALLGFVGVVLLWLRQLPKEILTTWTGRVGLAMFGGALVGWYVLVPRLLGFHQNNLAGTGSYFTQISGTLGSVWGQVYAPFYPRYQMDSVTAFSLLIAVSVAIPLIMVA